MFYALFGRNDQVVGCGMTEEAARCVSVRDFGDWILPHLRIVSFTRKFRVSFLTPPFSGFVVMNDDEWLAFVRQWGGVFYEDHFGFIAFQAANSPCVRVEELRDVVC